mgnify:CR=1 FL=1
MAELIYESVIVALNKAIKIDPKNVDAYIMLAEVYEKSGRLDEARTTLEKVLDIGELSSKDKDEINSRIKNLEFLVTISKASGEYDEPMALELSNASKYDIHYSIETENNRLVATDMKYTSPILLDEDGSYIVKAYTVDSRGEMHDKTEVKYTIKLGHLDKNSWENIGNIYRYRGEDGKIVTGWVKIDESWYYILDSGECSTGWKEIDGKWYHFADDGEMETNRHIGGYYVGADGVRTDIMKEPVPPSKNWTDKFLRGEIKGLIDEELGIVSYVDMTSTGKVIDRGSFYEIQDVIIETSGSMFYEAYIPALYVRKMQN